MKEPRFTNKQRAFVAAYTGDAGFDATKAARLAGYRANSKHSFESIGSELLKKAPIKAAVDEFFAKGDLSAEEVLREVIKIALGNSKDRDKLKALDLMMRHHGLLDGSWVQRSGKSEITLRVEYETQKRLDSIYNEVNQEVERFNRDSAESNRRKDQLWGAIREKYSGHPMVVQALDELKNAMAKSIEQTLRPEPESEPEPQVEIIPPARRLQPSSAE